MNEQLPNWSEFLETMKPAQELIALALTPDDEQFKAELCQQFILNIAFGYFILFNSTPDHPDWAPMPGTIFLAQPNPDDVYLQAPLRGDRTYRVSGERGTTLLMVFVIKQGMAGMIDPPHPLVGFYDADELTIDANGCFEFILSSERPAGYKGDWLYLDPKGKVIQARIRAYDWENERDGRLAIECLDGPLLKPMPDKAEIAQRMNVIAKFVDRHSRLWLNYHRDLRARQEVNTLALTGFTEFGGLGEQGAGQRMQHYWQGIFEFKQGEALILETEIPKEVKFWNIQLNDLLFNTIDYVNRQGSLNGRQARLDKDGRFRAVLSTEDPGIHNWLDTDGYHMGVVVGRWVRSDSNPVPTLKRVPLADIRKHLPPDTPTISAEERGETVRRRRRAWQMRRRW